jgi:hypothetical protein
MKAYMAILLILLLGGATATLAEKMPAPASVKYMFCGPQENPTLDVVPENANPMGCGAFATGGDTISIRVNFMEFASKVNIFFGFWAPSLGPDVFLLTAADRFVPLSKGLVPWRANTTGPIDESLFGDISAAALPSQIYRFFILITPAQLASRNGRIHKDNSHEKSEGSYYLWEIYLPNKVMYGFLHLMYQMNCGPGSTVFGSNEAHFYVENNRIQGILSLGNSNLWDGRVEFSGLCGQCTAKGVSHITLGGELRDINGQPTLCFKTTNGTHICDMVCGPYTFDCTAEDYTDEFWMPLTDGYIVEHPNRVWNYALHLIRK